MPRPLYPEHEMMPIPESLLLCPRCKQGLIYQPNNAEPFCMKCGDSGRPGELYVRASTKAEWDVRKEFQALKESGLDALVHEDGWAITTPEVLDQLNAVALAARGVVAHTAPGMTKETAAYRSTVEAYAALKQLVEAVALLPPLSQEERA